MKSSSQVDHSSPLSVLKAVPLTIRSPTGPCERSGSECAGSGQTVSATADVVACSRRRDDLSRLVLRQLSRRNKKRDASGTPDTSHCSICRKSKCGSTTRGRRYFLRWRIFARMRRLRLPILRRPFPVLFVPMSKSTPQYDKWFVVSDLSAEEPAKFSRLSACRNDFNALICGGLSASTRRRQSGGGRFCEADQ